MNPAPLTHEGRRDAVRRLLFSRETVMRGLAELARDGGEEVYTSFVADRFEAALEDGFARDTGPDNWRPYKEGIVDSLEAAGSGLNLAYDDEESGWESAQETVDRLLKVAVSSCRSLIPVLSVQKLRWEVEDWRRDRPGFQADPNLVGGMPHFHDVMAPEAVQDRRPILDVRPQIYESEISLYPKLEVPAIAAHPDTAGTLGYSIGTGPAPRSSMVEPTRHERAKEYMDAAEYQRIFHGGGGGADMMGPPLGLGSIRSSPSGIAPPSMVGADASSNDRVAEFMRRARAPMSEADGLDSVSMISGRFR